MTRCYSWIKNPNLTKVLVILYLIDDFGSCNFNSKFHLSIYYMMTKIMVFKV